MARLPLKPERSKESKQKNLKPQRKGFAAMSPEKVEAIAHKGGAARAAQLGHEGYVALGHLGGQARAKQLGPQGFAALGRHGAEVRAQRAALGSEEALSNTKKTALSSGIQKTADHKKTKTIAQKHTTPPKKMPSSSSSKDS